MGRLFGTDGIRGVANQYPLTADSCFNIGRALASFFQLPDRQTKIIIGKDTRQSGSMIENALADGICSAGADAHLAGVLPTPGVACLVSSGDAAAGVVISASHNPYHDNGIKLFDSEGFKLSDDKEDEIEHLLRSDTVEHTSDQPRHASGKVKHLTTASESYLAFLRNSLSDVTPFHKLKIVLDCSNGATYAVAPKFFHDLGAQVEAISIYPDGKNINADCGSEHPEKVIQKVLDHKADIGLAFDGDGDRLIAVDEQGQVISGDRVLAICARDLKRR
ncbi:MAG: phosphoglucosamine mutase, partial [Desulfobacterales bacterium]|nr:phosphoglucosamine mutase [Desulfobacterales bacterium]